MEFRITGLEEHSITVDAPLAPNINIHGTAFAGSIYALGVLTAWGLVTHIVHNAALDTDVVVARAEIIYRSPLTTSITCSTACQPDEARVLLKALSTKGRGGLELSVEIGDAPHALLHARMVVIRR